MNLKRTLLSLAIAGATAAPMIASAANGAVYGNIRYGISQTDSGVKGADAVSAFGNKASRFGIKGETDLGNGMTAYGHWEVGMFAGALRELKVGVKGDFGNVYMGDKTNHAWDSVMSTDDTWWYGGSQKITDGVQSNAITYQGGSGAISFGVTAKMSGDTTTDADGATTTNTKQESVDTLEYVIGYDAGVAQFAFGVHDKSAVLAADDQEPITGFLVKSTIADVAVALDFQSQDGITAAADDVTSMQLQLGYGSFLLQHGQKEASKVAAVDETHTTTVLTYTQSLGPDTSIWYEYASDGDDIAGSDDTTSIAATLKYNIM